jgi:DNA repair protein RecN (Recombination protein N)
VLCITHLPQVAVHGGEHFVVEKHVEGGRTTTGIRGVSADERVREVARMLGGSDRGGAAVKHARALLRKP